MMLIMLDEIFLMFFLVVRGRALFFINEIRYFSFITFRFTLIFSFHLVWFFFRI